LFAGEEDSDGEGSEGSDVSDHRYKNKKKGDRRRVSGDRKPRRGDGGGLKEAEMETRRTRAPVTEDPTL
jgi:hypothetical protein